MDIGGALRTAEVNSFKTKLKCMRCCKCRDPPPLLMYLKYTNLLRPAHIHTNTFVHLHTPTRAPISRISCCWAAIFYLLRS
jgi:hypothetical protein